MDIDIRIERPEELRAELTSGLATEAFEKDGPALSAARFSWTYGGGYDDVSIVSAFANGTKIGQLGCLFKTFVLDGSECTSAELVDLFVSPQYRSTKVASLLYRDMKKVVAAKDAQLMFAFANAGASVLNKRYFKMDEATSLPLRLGFPSRLGFSGSGSSVTVLKEIERIAQACIECASFDGGGVKLTVEQLRNRISSPVHHYVCATNGEIAILASPRVIRSIPVLLICATFAAKKAQNPDTVPPLVRSLCRVTGRRAYLYAGWNDAIGMRNGFGLPERLSRDKFVIQSNFLGRSRKSIARFELLDVDYG
jgi:GNAT superfamily N-acetyltransferase